ncbi:ATP-binding protein [Nodosilinea sp. PGN35]|uniref:ATP-binding protein n=1 Tax=Nodosilinea sp. PGN35 TaxID=3020489 RepID=UPI0023B32148|nr:ATP-binding protein [Nodosilinea sp. TSF1-S3]MDF0367040.1 ATP-binding protein [Nodosilinea sp. TSF1-S3]
MTDLNENSSINPVGVVLGTQEATPLDFWVAVLPRQVLRLDDVVTVRIQRPDGQGMIDFYGVVDQVRRSYEGIDFETDSFLASRGDMPVTESYAAHVQVTRIHPEDYLPPAPGANVFLAREKELEIGLFFDEMDQKTPAGKMQNGSPAYLNFEFIDGNKGAHINISGLSGVATKTSYALFLLHSIFNSGVLGSRAPNTKALIFNVKGEDLFFLDKFNSKQDETNKAAYELLKLPFEPFKDCNFRASPKRNGGVPFSNLNQRADEKIQPYIWSLKEVCRKRLLKFLMSGNDIQKSNLPFLLSNIEELLSNLANDKHNKGNSGHLITDRYGESGKTKISNFSELVEFLEDKLLGIGRPGEDDEGNPDARWLARNAPATAMALVRRLRAAGDEVSHLIRGDLEDEQFERYKLAPLAPGHCLTVADINKLGSIAKMFVVGVTLQEIFQEKEKSGQGAPIFIVLDELNKYAPREGYSPIKDLLVDIAERGRSLGIILIGAQQTASEVERRVVGQSAIRVVGRLDGAEAQRPEYNFLTGTCRQRAQFMKSGTMFIHQPEVPTPLLINFPFPAYATRSKEVADDPAEEEELAADLDRV